MSDQTAPNETYYSREDLPPDDTKTAVELYQQQVSHLQGSLTQANNIIEQLQAVLDDRYKKAEAAADEQAKLEIVAQWEQTNQLVNIVLKQDSALVMGSVTIEKLAETVTTVTTELETLVQAVNNQDPNDPRVAELMTLVREDAMEDLDDLLESASEDGYDNAQDDAYESAWENSFDTIVENLDDIFDVPRSLGYIIANLLLNGSHTTAYREFDKEKLALIGKAIVQNFTQTETAPNGTD